MMGIPCVAEPRPGSPGIDTQIAPVVEIESIGATAELIGRFMGEIPIAVPELNAEADHVP